MSQEVKPDETVWTPANIVTMLRICGVPLFLVAILSPWPEWIPSHFNGEIWKPWVATLVFIILAATDGVDGHLARSRNEVTNFGKFVDPLADKILTTSALLVLIELGVLPSWPVIIILTREFIVAGIRMVAATQQTVIAASWYGKAKTVSQIIAIVMFMIKDSRLIMGVSPEFYLGFYILSWIVMLVALALTIISMVDYFAKARDLLGFKPKKSAKKKAKPEAETLPSVNQLEKDLAALAEQTIAEAISKKVSLATAESLTGGMISSSLSGIPGASAVLKGGVVSYSEKVKQSALHVSPETLAQYGVVSEEVAYEMARGAQDELSAQCTVAVTGVAGPGADSQGNPQGTVCFAWCFNDASLSETVVFKGNRDQVRLQTSIHALKRMNTIFL